MSHMKKVKKIGRFHVITDTVLQTCHSHIQLAALAIAGGADTIQLREKGGSTRAMIDAAVLMKAMCDSAGVTFIVNDRVDVAIASGADGVHLGQDDFPIPLARKLLGEKATIGGSAGTLEEARKCLSEGRTTSALALSIQPAQRRMPARRVDSTSFGRWQSQSLCPLSRSAVLPRPMPLW